jgi:hypothetical protein
VKIEEPNNITRLSKQLGGVEHEVMHSRPFSVNNFNLAKRLCAAGTANGWWFPGDQKQVMLCQPSKFLKFVKVLEIEPPVRGNYKVNFTRTASTGMWEKRGATKFKLMPTTLNAIVNTNQPSNKYFYTTVNEDEKVKNYYDVNGRIIVIPKNKAIKTFNYRGNTYVKHKFTEKLIQNKINKPAAKIMANRILAQSGHSVNPKSLRIFRLITPNVWKRMHQGGSVPKLKTNINLNASSLFN